MERVVPAENLQEFAKDCFIAVGVPPADASWAASALIEADVQGLVSHGVSRLAAYVDALGKGKMNPVPNIQVHVTGYATAVVDGDNGLGSISALKAVTTAIDLASSAGLGATTVRNGNHAGALSAYTEIAANRGMVGLCCCNAQPAIPPWGGRRAYFGTNPIALAAPGNGPFPVSIDLATSVVARGKIILAAKREEQIPEGWAIDIDGRPTVNAKHALAGAVLPMAGPKGYALALLVEILSGVLSGANFGHNVGSIYDDSSEPPGTGFFFLAINPGHFVGNSTFAERIGDMIEDIHNNPLAVGHNQVLVPGERRYLERMQRQRDGIPVPNDTWHELHCLAALHGLTLPVEV